MRDHLVFIPGFTCTRELWEAQIAHLRDRYDITIGDHRNDNSIAAIAERILAASPTRFSLAGLSMGGYIALEIIARAPERIERLALLDTQATPETPDARKTRLQRLDVARKDGVRAAAELNLPRFVHPARIDDAPLRAKILRMAEDTGLAAWERQTQAIMDRPDARPNLGAISVKTLVLVGDRDEVTPPERAHEMASAIPGATLVEIAQCGHLSTIERPDSVNRALDDWLRTPA
ncbi:MAG: alpha/beta fold hydrolase [Hyphomicrobiales bacterium]|nr:alpha/beta fold hydrolase [Hyphomicrobiales bacterium]